MQCASSQLGWHLRGRVFSLFSWDLNNHRRQRQSLTTGGHFLNYILYIWGALHAKSDGLKNFNFWFPSFFDIFLIPIKKLFLVKFEIFFITGLKDIEFRVFAHNFFKNGSNSIFFFFFEIFVFLHTFSKTRLKFSN